ncbi:hypothetical protein KSS87_022534 [Heliosperma pusillum]|nr:hypothetical protein KSS87_022534 [Heliosperma pusillum]
MTVLPWLSPNVMFNDDDKIMSYKGVDGLGFDIHHRFSDPVKSMFGLNSEFPEKGTMEYYTAMVHRDRFHGRRLAGQTDHKTPLTFAAGNATLSIPELGFLYYANVSIGTPASWYLVALDTGSGLFWLPCDCSSHCVRSYNFSSTETTIQFNIYSLSTSSTGARLSCTSPLCERSCSPSETSCPYIVEYLSANTSSSGYVVQDLLHLRTDNAASQAVDVRIPFGCGTVQTGHFLESGAPNGLFGLSMDVVSLPSIDSQVKDRRVKVHPDSALQFCYLMTSKPEDLIVPVISLTMRGGDKLTVVHPWLTVIQDDTLFYCLGVVMSDHDINIIGENFMTGYRIVFDNEKPAVGWTPSDCGESVPFTPTTLIPQRRSAASSSLLHGYLAIAIIVIQVFSVQLTVL